MERSARTKESYSLYVFLLLLAHSVDFWLVKNLSGRLLAGLRWWNVAVTDDAGVKGDFSSGTGGAAVIKRFECRDLAQRESSPIPPSQVRGKRCESDATTTKLAPYPTQNEPIGDSQVIPI